MTPAWERLITYLRGRYWLALARREVSRREALSRRWWALTDPPEEARDNWKLPEGSHEMIQQGLEHGKRAALYKKKSEKYFHKIGLEVEL